MSMEDYRKAYKAGKREYQSRLLRGQKPTLRYWMIFFRMNRCHRKISDWCRFRFHRS